MKPFECEIERNAPYTPFEKAASGIIILGLVAAFFAIGSLCGCVYKGAKVTEGTDLAVGLNVPVSEGTLQFQALNYLSGFRLAVDRNAILRCRYTVSETNSYLGVVHTRVAKAMDAEIVPLGDGGATNTPCCCPLAVQSTNTFSDATDPVTLP